AADARSARASSCGPERGSRSAGRRPASATPPRPAPEAAERWLLLRPVLGGVPAVRDGAAPPGGRVLDQRKHAAGHEPGSPHRRAAPGGLGHPPPPPPGGGPPPPPRPPGRRRRGPLGAAPRA